MALDFRTNKPKVVVVVVGGVVHEAYASVPVEVEVFDMDEQDDPYWGEYVAARSDFLRSGDDGPEVDTEKLPHVVY